MQTTPRIRPSEITAESHYLNRRSFLAAAGGVLAATVLPADAAVRELEAVPGPHSTSETPNSWEDITTYNNFYEFGTDKEDPWRNAQDFVTEPWTVAVSGECERPGRYAYEDIVRPHPLEERVYRHRCVEAWSMAVPYSGFAMKALVDFARPLSSAKYVTMTTFENPDVAGGQRAAWYPWPYIEGLTMAEARHDLAFIATGLYGKPIPKQNGAPLRLAVPWKYGFKHIKGIVRFEFTDQRPKSFWEAIQASEYGFWANVNPEVPHPRWSQASERVLGLNEQVPTLLYNGYGEYVADLYKDIDPQQEALFM
jgi:sulfoxide reductase catalytic subunit YedY